VLGSDGKQLAASGHRLQPELASRIVSGWQDARRRQRRLFPSKGRRTPVVVVVLPASDATVLVAMEREAATPCSNSSVRSISPATSWPTS
jgi:hypothetical protein